MVRRALPYLAAVGAVGVVSTGLGLVAWVLRIPRVETFLLVLVLLVGAIAWRLGRGAPRPRQVGGSRRTLRTSRLAHGDAVAGRGHHRYRGPNSTAIVDPGRQPGTPHGLSGRDHAGGRKHSQRPDGDRGPAVRGAFPGSAGRAVAQRRRPAPDGVDRGPDGAGPRQCRAVCRGRADDQSPGDDRGAAADRRRSARPRSR